MNSRHQILVFDSIDTRIQFLFDSGNLIPIVNPCADWICFCETPFVLLSLLLLLLLLLIIPLFIKNLVIYRLDLLLRPFIDFLLLRYPRLPAALLTAPAHTTSIPPS